MKKLIVILLMLICNVAISQTGWFQINTGASISFHSVFFINENTGWCAGDSAKMYKTTNGGLNWSFQTLHVNNIVINSIKFANNYTGYAGGGFQGGFGGQVYLFKTTNQGNSWFTIYSDQYFEYIYLSSISIINPDTLYFSTFGQYSLGPSFGGVYKTINGGTNFINIFNLTGVNSVSFLNYQAGWISAYYSSDVGGSKDYIYKTTNSGSNWMLQYKDTLTAVSINKLQFVNQSTGFGLAGANWITNSTKLFKTTNSGLNWNKISINNSRNNLSLFFVNDLTGWICGQSYISNSSIDRTTNGGETFTNQRNINETIRGIYFLNSLTGYAVGNNGKLLKTTNGGVTFINQLSNLIPDKYSLCQNYPNPFNPITKIKFDIQKSVVSSQYTVVTLKVYDVMGREVQTLVNERLHPGTYEVTFDASMLTSGIYFYRMITDGFSETKKMTLIK